MESFDIYGKALVAAALAVATAAQAALADGHISSVEWMQVAAATATAVLVYLVPVASEWPHGKSIIGAVVPALGVVSTLAVNGWRSSTVPEVLLAVVTAALVRYAPAVSTVRPGGIPAN